MMNAKELIHILKACNPKARVIVSIETFERGFQWSENESARDVKQSAGFDEVYIIGSPTKKQKQDAANAK